MFEIDLNGHLCIMRVWVHYPISIPLIMWSPNNHGWWSCLKTTMERILLIWFPNDASRDGYDFYQKRIYYRELSLPNSNGRHRKEICSKTYDVVTVAMFPNNNNNHVFGWYPYKYVQYYFIESTMANAEYDEARSELLTLGIDEVYCLSANDAFVIISVLALFYTCYVGLLCRIAILQE